MIGKNTSGPKDTEKVSNVELYHVYISKHRVSQTFWGHLLWQYPLLFKEIHVIGWARHVWQQKLLWNNFVKEPQKSLCYIVHRVNLQYEGLEGLKGLKGLVQLTNPLM